MAASSLEAILSEMPTTLTDRNLSFAVAYNVRHMGGYRTTNGRETRPDVIRAASLHRLTDEGVEALVAHGVRTVVDLRSETEREQTPTPNMEAHGVNHVFAPVFKTDAAPQSFARDFQGYGPIYRRFLETGRDAYRTLFGVIAESDGAVLFHFAAGKDRTGVAAALHHAQHEVSDDDIAADYSCSAALLKDAFSDWKPTPEQQARMGEISEEARAKLLGSEPEYILDTLEHVRVTWGSSAGYLAEIGVTDAEITRIRSRMVW